MGPRRAWPAGEGSVDDVEWGANLIVANLDMDSAGTLVLADNYYPGWTATVDDKQVRIHRANCIFRAIHLPEGKSRVEFAFTPASFRIGLWVGIISWTAFALCFIKARRGKNQGQGD